MSQTLNADLQAIYNKSFGSVVVENLKRDGLSNDLVHDGGLSGILRRRSGVESGTDGAGQPGGENAAQFPIHYGSSTTAESYGPNDPIPAASPELFEEFVLPWARYREVVEIDRLTRAGARGGATELGGIDIWTYEMNQKMKNLFEKIDDDLYLDGSTATALDGYFSFLSDSNVYAGIDQAANPYWQALVQDASGGALTRERLRDFRAILKKDRKARPTAIYTSYKQHDKYQALLDNNVRYMTMTMGEAQFQVLTFEGLPIFALPNWPDNSWAFIQEDVIKWRYQPQVIGDVPGIILEDQTSMEGLPFALHQEPTGRDSDALVISIYTQLVCKDPSVQGVINNLA